MRIGALSRKQDPPDVQPRLGVGAVVLRGNQVLLIRRGKAPRKDAWTLPGGGVEAGETLRQAVVRETREETGLIVRPHVLLCLHERIERNMDQSVVHHHVVVDYLCQEVGGTLQSGTDAREVRFMTFAQACAVEVTEGLLPMLAKVLARYGPLPSRRSRTFRRPLP